MIAPMRASGARTVVDARTERVRANAHRIRTRSIVRAMTGHSSERDDESASALVKLSSVALSAMLMVSPVSAVAGEDASAPAEGNATLDVEALYAKTLDAQNKYERAVEGSRSLAPLSDDKDNKEFESWNWQKLVDEKSAGGAAKYSRARAQPLSARQQENASRLEEIKSAAAARDAERDAKKRAEIKERDAAAQAKVDARRAEQKALYEARARQAAEETAAKRKLRDEQRARMENLRNKTPEEKLVDAEAFRNRNSPNAKSKTKRAAAKTAKTVTAKKSSYVAKQKIAAAPKTAPKRAAPAKYSGALDRNSFRNVKKQEYGAGAAPFVFVVGCALIYYLLLQEEED